MEVLPDPGGVTDEVTPHHTEDPDGVRRRCRSHPSASFSVVATRHLSGLGPDLTFPDTGVALPAVSGLPKTAVETSIKFDPPSEKIKTDLMREGFTSSPTRYGDSCLPQTPLPYTTTPRTT